MRFTVRSLSGKLIISATLTLLLCMLLFAAASWYFLKAFYENEAKSDAIVHLALIEHAFQKHTNLLSQEVSQVARDSSLQSALAQPSSSSSQQARLDLLSALSPYRFSSLQLVSPGRQVLISTDTRETELPGALQPLIAGSIARQPYVDCRANLRAG